jgi:hypothetical protein
VLVNIPVLQSELKVGISRIQVRHYSPAHPFSLSGSISIHLDLKLAFEASSVAHSFFFEWKAFYCETFSTGIAT